MIKQCTAITSCTKLKTHAAAKPQAWNRTCSLFKQYTVSMLTNNEIHSIPKTRQVTRLIRSSRVHSYSAPRLTWIQMGISRGRAAYTSSHHKNSTILDDDYYSWIRPYSYVSFITSHHSRSHFRLTQLSRYTSLDSYISDSSYIILIHHISDRTTTYTCT